MLTFCKCRALPGTLNHTLKAAAARMCSPGQNVKRILLAMRITAAILLIFSLHVTAKSVSQTITLSGKDIPLVKVFSEIKKQSGYLVVASEDLVNAAKPITVDVKDYPLLDFMNETFSKLGLAYVIENKTIFLKKLSPGTDLSPRNDASLRDKYDGSSPVKGRVVNDKGEPVEGVSVTVKGTNVGTSTNANGEFFLDDIDDNATLIFTHTSIEKTEQKRNARAELTIGVKVRSSILDEVQVIPYGTQTKRFSVGNVTTVKGEDIAKQPVSNPLLALQGRVPGLFITQETGVPGGAVTVRIQGQNSIGWGNEPFYVIDGVPYFLQLPKVGFENVIKGGNPLNFINPTDIESIEILKDADATAIYGSRAANGAILITTKKGKDARTAIDINVQEGWGRVTRKLNMLNRRQYLDMRYEAFANDSIDWTNPSITANDLKIWDTTRETNWQNELIGGTAQYSDVNLGLSGGNAGLQYLIGGTFHRETSVFPRNSDDRRGSFHFNLSSVSNDEKLRLSLSASYMVDNNKLPAYDPTLRAIQTEPVAPNLYNNDGTLNWAQNASGTSTWRNPIADLLVPTYKNNTNNLVSSAMVKYMLFSGLDIQISGGYSKMQTTSFTPIPLESYRPEDQPFTPRVATYGNRNLNTWNIEPQIIYRRNFAKGKLEGLIGGSIQQNNSDAQTLFGRGYISNLVMEDIRSATEIAVDGSSSTIYKYNAFFGRLNYNLNDKYIIHFTGRRDGSSRFGAKNKFHSFGSAGIAWIFSQEKGIADALPFLSFGKLRGSYGSTGSDQIPDYYYLSLYSRYGSDLVPYQNTTGYSSDILSNPYIQWEETRKLQFGIDLGFFKDKMIVNLTHARNRSSNQLLRFELPEITGFNAVNLTLNTTVIKRKHFSWTSSFNITIPKNELIAFPDLDFSSQKSLLSIGQPLGRIKLFHFLGVDPATGLYQFADSLGKPTSTPVYGKDDNVFKSAAPKFYGGIQNSFSYKRIRLDFLFQFVKQEGPNAYFNASTFPPGSYRGTRGNNQSATVIDRWKNPGDIKPIMRYSSDPFEFWDILNSAIASDAGYTDASYIRLKNLSLAYQFPLAWVRKMHFRTAEMFTQGQNLITFTKYKGLDPENQGLSSLPPLRVITLGLKIVL
jgi:TonB-dependent starch-binding outer membrane protein SusC